MTDDPHRSGDSHGQPLRRDILRATSAVGLAGLAGCQAVDDSPETSDGGDPEDRTTSEDDPEDRTTSEDDPEDRTTSEDDPEDRILTNTSEVRPGYFTEFAKGLLVGAHPLAVEEPIRVDVEWFEPETPSDLEIPEERIPSVDEFVEVAAMDIDEPTLSTPHNSKFYVAIPVPEEFDETRLEPMEFVHGEFAHPSMDSMYLWSSGIFDPEERLFIIGVEDLGGSDYPTRVGVTEHPARHTDETESFLAPLLTDYFPHVEADIARAGRSDVRGYDLLGAPDLSEVEFEIEWKAESDEDQTIIDDVRNALEQAYPVFLELNQTPEPELKEKLTIGGTTYQYFIHDPDSTVWVNGWKEDNLCQEGYNGAYVSVGDLAYTCVGASDHAGTTRHELFHAFQSHLLSDTGSSSEWIVEATARLAQNLDLLTPVTGPQTMDGFSGPVTVDRAIDISLFAEGDQNNVDLIRFAGYRSELFWVDLLVRDGNTDFAVLGDLFAHGKETTAAKTFVEDDIAAVETLGEAHWKWVQNAAFEGGPDAATSYSHDCQPNTDAFYNGIQTTAIDVSNTEVEVGDVVGGTIEFDINCLPGYRATMAEIELPSFSENYYYDLEFTDLAPSNAWLYPDAGECTRSHRNWDVRTFNDGETMSVANRGWSKSAYLLVRGADVEERWDPLTVEARGPYPYATVEILSPGINADIEMTTPLHVLLDVTIPAVGDVEDAFVEISFAGEEMVTESIPTTSKKHEFAVQPLTFCEGIDDAFTRYELTVELSVLDGTGEPVLTETETHSVRVVVDEMDFGYDIHADTRMATAVTNIGPIESPTPITFVRPGVEEDGVRLTGWANRCAGSQVGLDSELEWWDVETWEHLATGPELFLATPDAFETDDGTRRDRELKLTHSDTTDRLLITVRSCEPYCLDDHETPEIPRHLLQALILCPDGSYDADCFFTDLAEFDDRLDRVVRDELFDGTRSRYGFPLESFESWPVTDVVGPALETFARRVAGFAVRDSALAECEVVPFDGTLAATEDELAPRMNRIERRLAWSMAYGLRVGLNAFASPRAGGQNLWRYFGYARDEPNPNVLYRDVSLQGPVETALLGAGSAIGQYGTRTRLLPQKVELGTVYGFLAGVGDEARTNQRERR